MAELDKQFVGSIPEIYERYLVPLIFVPYAADLADRLGQLDPDAVLETAAGTGVLARAMAARLPPRARIVATDLNRPMLDQAQAAAPSDARITWQQADALALPFGDASFAVVTCQFGVMFFPDKVKAYAEARRVLKPRGRLLFNVWGEIAANEFAAVVTQALASVFPGDPPRFMARTPHGYCDMAAIRDQLQAAGFGSVTTETVDRTSIAPSPQHAAIAFCQGTPLRNEIEARDASRLQEATQVAAAELARRFGSGAIEGRMRAHVINAAVA